MVRKKRAKNRNIIINVNIIAWLKDIKWSLSWIKQTVQYPSISKQMNKICYHACMDHLIREMLKHVPRGPFHIIKNKKHVLINSCKKCITLLDRLYHES